MRCMIGETYSTHVLFSSGAYFQLSGDNSLSNRHWSAENPALIHEVLLHDLKVRYVVCYECI